MLKLYDFVTITFASTMLYCLSPMPRVLSDVKSNNDNNNNNLKIFISKATSLANFFHTL